VRVLKGSLRELFDQGIAGHFDYRVLTRAT
jgi:hypothetical protein